MTNHQLEVPAAPADPDRSDDRTARGDVIAISAALLLVAVASTVGYALLRSGVPLNLQSPPLFARFVPHVGPGTPFAVTLGILAVLFAPRLATRWTWRRLSSAGAIAAIGWTSSLALIDGWQQGWAGRLATDTEYLHDLPRIDSVATFLRTFTTHILDFQPGSWTTHVSSHPPGATLVFIVLQRIGLGGGGWAGALVILVGSTSGIAVCTTIRTLGAPLASRHLMPFAVFFPGAVWVGVSADGLFAGVAAWGIALAVLGSKRGGRTGIAVAGIGGVLLGYTVYMSYGLVLLGVLVLAALMLAGHRRIWLATAAGAVLVAVAFTQAGFDWLQGEKLLTQRYYQGVASLRPYWYFVWANLAALTLSSGPVVAAGLRRAVVVLMRRKATRDRWGHDREVLVPALLSVAAMVGLLIADVTGLSKAETERIWLPFGFWILAGIALVPKKFLPVALGVQIAVALLVNHLELTYW